MMLRELQTLQPTQVYLLFISICLLLVYRESWKQCLLKERILKLSIEVGDVIISGVPFTLSKYTTYLR